MPAREAFKIRSPDLRDPESGDQNPGTKIRNPQNPSFLTKIHEIRVCLAPPGAKNRIPYTLEPLKPLKTPKNPEKTSKIRIFGVRGGPYHHP